MTKINIDDEIEALKPAIESGTKAWAGVDPQELRAGNVYMSDTAAPVNVLSDKSVADAKARSNLRQSRTLATLLTGNR